MRILVYVFVILLLPITAYCSDEALVDIENLIQSLSKATAPTLSEYYRFYGSGAESELQIVYEICKTKLWIPPDQHKGCLDFIKNREAQRDQTPSYYLLWLKTKLPLSSKLTVHDVKEVRGEGSFSYELIRATLGDVNIVFFRPLSWRNQFGLISISEIDGIPLKGTFEKDLRNPETIQNLLQEADRRASASDIRQIKESG